MSGLTIGSRLGVYEVTAEIGAGGMGTVYRATDTRLKRQVALKVLPASLAGDPQRLARLNREAEVLASLNHPHIAALYGVEDSRDVTALVMELVEGEDLGRRIAREPIEVDEALSIGKQIADALEAAHEQGIVHRDLKPANVRLRPDGTVKVLDFGLAKPTGADGGSAPAVEDSPTITAPIRSQMGVILGTALYMAPEQARGKAVDRRADIWAFGCVLYEMLSGRRAFGGETVTDVLSAILSHQPDLSALRPGTPPAVRSLVGRCLEKNPRQRLRDIGEARILLENPQVAAIPSSAVKTRRRATAWLFPLVAAGAAALAITTSWLWMTRIDGGGNAARRLTRFDIQPPDRAVLTVVFRTAVAVSGNGDTIAFTAVTEGVNRIHVRTRSDTIAHAIAGSEGGTNPAVSPDGKWVTFYADGSVKKAAVDGTAATIAAARDVRGMTWLDDRSLILTDNAAAPLIRMTAEGGDAHPITTLGTGERTHRWPQALPGGKAALFTIGTLDNPDSYDDSNIEAVILATGERRIVTKGAMARYCGDGHLVYSKGSALFAISFDANRLTTSGIPIQVVPSVGRDASTGAAHFDCGTDGTLAYVPAAGSELHALVWFDKTGQMQPVPLAPARFQEVRISPDGARVTMLDGTTGRGDVWIYEFATRKYNRLTFTSSNAAPIWSADGRAVYYTSFDAGGSKSTIFRKLADGSHDAESLGSMAGRAYLTWVDAAGRMAVLDVTNLASDRGDVVRMALGSGAVPQPLVASSFNEFAGAISPGGQWLAYQADNTGRPEIYVRDLKQSGAAWQVTVAGGEEPHWSRDGRQLFYRTANRLMAVPIEPGVTFRYGNPTGLFDGIYNTGIESGRSYDVDPVTGRFLLVRPADTTAASAVIRVTLNWDLGVAGLSRR